MRRFAQLFRALDGTTSTGAKVAALAAYFASAPEADRVWTIALLSGRRPKRVIAAPDLRQWAAEAAGVPLWLFEESYAVVGDLAETVSLILPPGGGAEPPDLDAVIRALMALAPRPVPEKRAAVLRLWADLQGEERFLFTKLLTGGFRMGVSQGLMVKGLARATGVDEAALAHRLMGGWDPAMVTFPALIGDGGAPSAQPYPFALASALEGPPEGLGDRADWLAEWKWDGIRGQLVRRDGVFALWSRGEDLITDRFPDLAPLQALPEGTVIDGEVLAWEGGGADGVLDGGGRPLPFAALQTRIGRKTVPKSVLKAAPAILLAYDLLEAGGTDLRALPLSDRRARLAALVADLPPGAPLRLTPEVPGDWAALAAARGGARAAGAEGLMLKRRASAYHLGRKRGDWWKWKVDPMTVDAVMVYAQAGHGRRAGLFTDFTFAVRDGDALVPFAKAYSGLTDAEFTRVSAWVQKNTLERFGPVRRVSPELVFELAFEGIQASPRHKSGIALRFPRMLRWRQDKPVAEIDTLEGLRGLLAAQGGPSAPLDPPEDI